MNNYWIDPDPKKLKKLKTNVPLWVAFIVLMASIFFANYIKHIR
jgi:hypothetical protein